MPRGTTLTENERGIVIGLHESGMKIGEIAARVNRHRNTIRNFLDDSENYAKIKRSGRKPMVCDRTKREIGRLAVFKNMSAGQIKAELDLQVTRRRIQQILHESSNIRYENRSAKPRLFPHHRKARLQFAEKYKFWHEEWRNVIFSDEKKFNLDGPDGSQKYWRDSRQPRQTRYSRNFSGGSLMVWAGFGYHGKTPICFISHKVNAQMYVELLNDVLLDFAEDIYGESWTFQQDNASIHSAKFTKQFFASKNVPLLEWPAVSPDLNPVENLWSILSQQVYKNGRQFDTLKDLKEAIKEEWAKIDDSTLHSLINSMPFRLSQVVYNNGDHTKY